jgi:hypothetical protein
MEVHHRSTDPAIIEKRAAIIRQVFEEEWEEDEINWAAADFCQARSELCGSKDDAHARITKKIKEKIPDCTVITRWTDLDDLPYETFTD